VARTVAQAQGSRDAQRYAGRGAGALLARIFLMCRLGKIALR